MDGLVTAVIQDHHSGRVLMVGFMNEEAFRQTVETGYATFFSCSRNKLWLKGETSGHRLVVKDIATDCDRDALLIRVEAQGPGVCHEGYQSCFFRRLDNDEFLEYAQVYDDYYGTPKHPALDILDSGKDVLLEIDVQGARYSAGAQQLINR